MPKFCMESNSKNEGMLAVAISHILSAYKSLILFEFEMNLFYEEGKQRRWPVKEMTCKPSQCRPRGGGGWEVVGFFRDFEENK